MRLLIFFAALIALSSSLVLPAAVHNAQEVKLVGAKLVDYVNSKQNLWKAEHSGHSVERMKRKVMPSSFYKVNKEKNIQTSHLAHHNVTIPTLFDARQEWASCPSITIIRDQSDCASGWAHAAVGAMSDRFCIFSNEDVYLSAEDLMTCCDTCGKHPCLGGDAYMAWEWWGYLGVCTGGSYESQFGCKPYSIPPCGKTVNNVTWPDCPANGFNTTKCVNHCTSTNPYPKTLMKDRHFGDTAYNVGLKIEQIQKEIMEYGPVEALFTVYEDFYQYKSGIYVHIAGDELGSHAVRVIGWGTENGTPYWLAANSWNTNWGEQGYFRILRGVNECGFESAMVAGLPEREF